MPQQNTPPERTAAPQSTAPRLVAKPSPPEPSPVTTQADAPSEVFATFDDVAAFLGFERKPANNVGGFWFKQRLTLPLSKIKAAFDRRETRFNAELSTLQKLVVQLSGELAALRNEATRAAAEAKAAVDTQPPAFAGPTIGESGSLLHRLLGGRG